MPHPTICLPTTDSTLEAMAVYHEGVNKKGAKNITSLIMKTLKDMNLLQENNVGGELNLVFNNCMGQNKNHIIQNLLVYLTEAGFFKTIIFVFLIVGHNKNSADNLSHGGSRCCKEWKKNNNPRKAECRETRYSEEGKYHGESEQGCIRDRECII